ncbi:hypothetical protein E4T39_02761 [Aureobasidium subglaciale]|nr:hypothetical protein E4T39_02761 [Aureobasidium subglaciale]
MFFTSLFAILALASAQQALAQSCSNFTATNGYAGGIYTSTSSRSYIISKGVTCNTTQDCLVPYGGYVTVGRTLNVSDQSSWDSLFKTISSVVDIDFKEPETYPLGSNTSTFTITNGTSAYVVFSPFSLCTTGRLSGCDGNSLEGVIVEACNPELLSSGEPNGYIGSVTTDPETAAGITCNPSNTTQAKNGNYNGSSSCSSTEDKTGTASSMGGASLLLLSSALLVAFMGL